MEGLLITIAKTLHRMDVRLASAIPWEEDLQTWVGDRGTKTRSHLRTLTLLPCVSDDVTAL